MAYHRASDGTLSPAGTYATGGLGGVLAGSVVDHLASQGSLSYDQRHALLYAVNAGSDTISVFARARRPARAAPGAELRRVVPGQRGRPRRPGLRAERAGRRPAAGLPGPRAAGWSRSPARAARSAWTPRPARSSPTPRGRSPSPRTAASSSSPPRPTGMTSTCSASGSDGYLSAAPVVNAEPGTVPFAISFDRYGHLVIAEAGTNALATFALAPRGTLSLIDAVPTGARPPAGWPRPGRSCSPPTRAAPRRAASPPRPGGQLSLLGGASHRSRDRGRVRGGRRPVPVRPDRRARDRRRVRAWGAGGSLTEIGAVTVPGAAGGEGIVAS